MLRKTNIELSPCKKDSEKLSSSITEGTSKPIPIPYKTNSPVDKKSSDEVKREKLSVLLPFTPPLNQRRSNRLIREKLAASVGNFQARDHLFERANKFEAKKIEKNKILSAEANAKPYCYSEALKKYGTISNLNRSQSFPQCHFLVAPADERSLTAKT